MRQDRALAMFERLGGSEIKEVAARWFDNPNPVSAEEYRRRCLPYYNPTKGDPDVFSRTIFREDVGIHFWGDEIRRFDLSKEVARIRCPTLILSGELDPIVTVPDQEEQVRFAWLSQTRLPIDPRVPGRGSGIRGA